MSTASSSDTCPPAESTAQNNTPALKKRPSRILQAVRSRAGSTKKVLSSPSSQGVTALASGRTRSASGASAHDLSRQPPLWGGEIIPFDLSQFSVKGGHGEQAESGEGESAGEGGKVELGEAVEGETMIQHPESPPHQDQERRISLREFQLSAPNRVSTFLENQDLWEALGLQSDEMSPTSTSSNDTPRSFGLSNFPSPQEWKPRNEEQWVDQPLSSSLLSPSSSSISTGPSTSFATTPSTSINSALSSQTSDYFSHAISPPTSGSFTSPFSSPSLSPSPSHPNSTPWISDFERATNPPRSNSVVSTDTLSSPNRAGGPSLDFSRSDEMSIMGLRSGEEENELDKFPLPPGVGLGPGLESGVDLVVTGETGERIENEEMIDEREEDENETEEEEATILNWAVSPRSFAFTKSQLKYLSSGDTTSEEASLDSHHRRDSRSTDPPSSSLSPSSPPDNARGQTISSPPLQPFPTLLRRSSSPSDSPSSNSTRPPSATSSDLELADIETALMAPIEYVPSPTFSNWRHTPNFTLPPLARSPTLFPPPSLPPPSSSISSPPPEPRHVEAPKPVTRNPRLSSLPPKRPPPLPLVGLGLTLRPQTSSTTLAESVQSGRSKFTPALYPPPSPGFSIRSSLSSPRFEERALESPRGENGAGPFVASGLDEGAVEKASLRKNQSLKSSRGSKKASKTKKDVAGEGATSDRPAGAPNSNSNSPEPSTTSSRKPSRRSSFSLRLWKSEANLRAAVAQSSAPPSPTLPQDLAPILNKDNNKRVSPPRPPPVPLLSDPLPTSSPEPLKPTRRFSLSFFPTRLSKWSNPHPSAKSTDPPPLPTAYIDQVALQQPPTLRPLEANSAPAASLAFADSFQSYGLLRNVEGGTTAADSLRSVDLPGPEHHVRSSEDEAQQQLGEKEDTKDSRLETYSTVATFTPSPNSPTCTSASTTPHLEVFQLVPPSTSYDPTSYEWDDSDTGHVSHSPTLSTSATFLEPHHSPAFLPPQAYVLHPSRSLPSLTNVTRMPPSLIARNIPVIPMNDDEVSLRSARASSIFTGGEFMVPPARGMNENMREGTEGKSSNGTTGFGIKFSSTEFTLVPFENGGKGTTRSGGEGVVGPSIPIAKMRGDGAPSQNLEVRGGADAKSSAGEGGSFQKLPMGSPVVRPVEDQTVDRFVGQLGEYPSPESNGGNLWGPPKLDDDEYGEEESKVEEEQEDADADEEDDDVPLGTMDGALKVQKSLRQWSRSQKTRPKPEGARSRTSSATSSGEGAGSTTTTSSNGIGSMSAPVTLAQRARAREIEKTEARLSSGTKSPPLDSVIAALQLSSSKDGAQHHHAHHQHTSNSPQSASASKFLPPPPTSSSVPTRRADFGPKLALAIPHELPPIPPKSQHDRHTPSSSASPILNRSPPIWSPVESVNGSSNSFTRPAPTPPPISHNSHVPTTTSNHSKPISTSRSPSVPGTMSPPKVSERKLGYLDYKIWVGDSSSQISINVSPSIRCGEIVLGARSKGALSAPSLNVKENEGEVVLWEIWKSLGLERPIREYELLSEVVKSWDREENALILKRTTLSPLLAGSYPAKQPAPKTEQVQVEIKRGKWAKRYLHLDDGVLSHSKTDKPKDLVILCQLSLFEVYFVKPQFIYEMKAPTNFVFGLKSILPRAHFEDMADYSCFVSVKSEQELQDWFRIITQSRNVFVRQHVPSSSYHPSPDPSSSTSTSRHPSPLLPSSSSAAAHSIPVGRSRSNSSARAPPPLLASAPPPVPTRQGPAALGQGQVSVMSARPSAYEWSAMSEGERQVWLKKAEREAREAGQAFLKF